jgi:RNA polymerase-binding transcription factor DksA
MSEQHDTVEQDPAAAIDLDAIERDLTDVQRALDRLNDGSYWTDEITGETIPDDVLVTSPLARTVAATLN